MRLSASPTNPPGIQKRPPQNVVKATMQGLMSLRGPEEIARIRGKSVEEIVG